MDESASRTDALRHVRFVGRPTIAPRPPRRATPSLPAARPLAARPSEPAGEFISWVFARAELAVDSYRGEALRRRLPACLRALHAHTEAHARQIIDQRPDLLPAAVSALLIGVTDFFRDATVFEALRADVLPRLAAGGRPLRVWSAGCSRGAELYSMAILLARAGRLEGSFLLGSDCRHDAIEHAQAAVYNSTDLRKLEPSDRHGCFEEVGGRWRPIESLRGHVHWKVADLGRRIEQGPWDVILWRNMAIYLTPDAAASLWRGLAAALVPEGVLVVGKAERPPQGVALICERRCIYRACPGDGGRPSGPRPRRARAETTRTAETSI